MKAPISAFAALVFSMLLCSCGDSDTQATTQQEETAYEAGKRILFNAQTRFEYPKAVELLQQAVAQDSGDVSARVNLVYAFLKRGQYDRAAPQVNAAKALRATLSEREDLWLDALAYKVTDDIPREIAQWRAVVADFPEDRWAWYELASAQASIGAYEAAAISAGKAAALEDDPQKWEASWLYYLHSKALFRSGQYEAAIAAAAPGEATPSTWRSGFFRKALGEVKAGKKDSAALVEDYIEISNAEGRNNEAYTLANIALFYYEAGEYENAVKAAREGYALEPEAYQAWTLGYLLAENGQVEEAVSHMAAAAKTHPENPAVLAAHGWALYRAGAFEDARRATLDARRKSARWNYQIERNLKIIQTAVDVPSAPPAPTIPWLG